MATLVATISAAQAATSSRFGPIFTTGMELRDAFAVALDVPQHSVRLEVVSRCDAGQHDLHMISVTGTRGDDQIKLTVRNGSVLLAPLEARQ